MNRMQWNINDLRSELSSIKEKTPSQLQREKVDKNIQEIQAAQESTARSVSDLLVQIQSLNSEFRMLTGRYEEARYNADNNSAEMKEENQKLTAKFRELELSVAEIKKSLSQPESGSTSAKPEDSKQTEGVNAEGNKISEEGKTGEGVTKIPVSEKKEAPKTDVKDVYMAGYQAYQEGKTVEARDKLSVILKDYPDNEYTDNARFWIAESYYKDKSYEDAILAYEEVLRKNPKSSKVPGAMLKQGMSFYELKDEKTGKIILEKLIEKFPDSEQAEVARKKIGSSAATKKKK